MRKLRPELLVHAVASPSKAYHTSGSAQLGAENDDAAPAAASTSLLVFVPAQRSRWPFESERRVSQFVVDCLPGKRTRVRRELHIEKIGIVPMLFKS